MGRSDVVEAIICLDTAVWIKFLVTEEPAELTNLASELVRQVLTTARIVAPAFAWAEIGSVLRKKVRHLALTPGDAEALWTSFGALPIEYIEGGALRARAWQIAERYGLPTLYDAAFLACIELAPAPDVVTREFWTVDKELLRMLQSDRPPYVRELGVDT